MNKPLAAAALALLVAACSERASDYQKEMSKEADVDPSAATTAVPEQDPLTPVAKDPSRVP